MVDASLRATILENLRMVNQTLRIPILYITHDLGTAYHVSDHILVMYRGRIVEAGDIETVVTSPRHPYTQMLIDSIPWPDPNRRWGRGATEETSGTEVPDEHPGCRFAQRCPKVMSRCLDAQPPAYLTAAGHAASCYLYADDAAVADEDLGSLFTPAPS